MVLDCGPEEEDLRGGDVPFRNFFENLRALRCNLMLHVARLLKYIY